MLRGLELIFLFFCLTGAFIVERCGKYSYAVILIISVFFHHFAVFILACILCYSYWRRLRGY